MQRYRAETRGGESASEEDYCWVYSQFSGIISHLTLCLIQVFALFYVELQSSEMATEGLVEMQQPIMRQWDETSDSRCYCVLLFIFTRSVETSIQTIDTP